MTNKSSNLSEVNIPWPEKGDLLFVSGEDWWHNACLNYMTDDWESYIIGYKKAGDTIIKHIKEIHHDQDVLVFPVVFLYWQYIELRLKQIIKSGKELIDENPDFPTHHKLENL